MSDAARGFTAEISPAEGGIELAESVGAALRKAREAKGLSLPQASRDLCLKEDVLRAIESRQYGLLPKVPYCFGFVRTYARYLGLEPEEMVRRFRAEIGDAPQPTKLQPPQPIRSSRFPGRAAVTLSVLLAAGAYGAWYFHIAQPVEIHVPVTTADAHAPIAPVPLLDDETARKLNAKATETAEAPSDADPGKSGATTSAAPPKYTVVLRATAPCWVYVHDLKGKVVFHKTMNKGDEFQLPEKSADLVADLGNPTAMQIVVNGRVLKSAPGGGQSRRVHLDPKELAKLP